MSIREKLCKLLRVVIPDNSDPDRGLTRDRQLRVGAARWPGEPAKPVPQMFAELELEYLVKLRPGNMGLEVWGKSAQNVSKRTFGFIAGSLVTAGLLYLFFRDKVSSMKYQLSFLPI